MSEIHVTHQYLEGGVWNSGGHGRSASHARRHQRLHQTQAFFTKIYIDEDDQLRVENNRPFEMLLDPEINANALTWAQESNKARTGTIDDGKGSSLVRGVDLRREFDNFGSAARTVCSRWSRGFYRTSK